MNNTDSGKIRKPSVRNPEHSAGGPVKPVSVPQKHPVNHNPGARKVAPQNVQGARRAPSNAHAVKPAVQKKNPSSEHSRVKNAPQKEVARTDPKQSAGMFKGLVIAVIVILVALLGVMGFLFVKDETELLNREVTIEAGTVRPDISMYFKEEPKFPNLIKSNLNFDEVNINVPQTIRFNIAVYGLNYACTLIITDTVAPVGTGVPQQIFACEELPDALSCITGIEDITDVTASWEEVPDMSSGGNYLVYAVLMDGCGNETVVAVPFEVTLDDTPPELKGVKDIEIYLGDSVAYREKVTVTDDYDENPVLEIDTSAVDLTEAGSYDVIYTARDFSGNETTVTICLTVSEKPEGYVEPEVVYEAAREILDEITEPGMSDEEIALQIVWWCRYNIRFILRSEYNSWTEAAYSAYTYRSGNCYATAYAVKALLDVAGIENEIIERWPYETATHFWNYVKLNGQWYHCDATWREGYDSYFFMYTTKELHDFWQGGWNGFQYRVDEYPESATESVQYRIDYKNHTIEDP